MLKTRYPPVFIGMNIGTAIKHVVETIWIMCLFAPKIQESVDILTRNISIGFPIGNIYAVLHQLVL